MSVRRGKLGEPYCSVVCYKAAGKDIGLAHLGRYSGVCAFCQTPVNLAIGSGQGHPFRKTFLYVCSVCRPKAEVLAFKIQECCYCSVGIVNRTPTPYPKTLEAVDGALQRVAAEAAEDDETIRNAELMADVWLTLLCQHIINSGEPSNNKAMQGLTESIGRAFIESSSDKVGASMAVVVGSIRLNKRGPQVVDALAMAVKDANALREVRNVAVMNFLQAALEIPVGVMLAYGYLTVNPTPSAWILLVTLVILILCAGGLRIYSGIRNLYFRNRMLGIVSLVFGVAVSLITCFGAPTAFALCRYGIAVYRNKLVSAAFAMGDKGIHPDKILIDLRAVATQYAVAPMVQFPPINT